MRQTFTYLLAMVLSTIMTGQSAYNPNVLPMGDKESLMGNTGTGGMTSTGAVYYNPAALTQLEGSSFSLSGSAYLRFRFEGKPIATIAGTDLEYRGSGLSTIPTSAIGVRRRGSWHLAFSFMVPMQFNFEGQETWNIPLNGQNLKIKLLQNYQEKIFLGGLTAARRLGNGWSVGLTLYGQAYSYLSAIDLRGGITENPDLIVQSTSRQKIAPVDLLIIGGLHRSWEKWNLGLRLAAPSIYLFGKGDYYEYFFSNLGGGIESSELDIEKDKTKFRTPLDVRFGTVHRPNDRWQLALDVAYRFPLEYDVYDDERVASREDTKGNFRLNGGFEFKPREKMAFYGGASYTPTTLQETDELFGQDFWSLFGGAKLFTEHIETSVGLFYSRGKGEGNLAVGEGTATQLYEYLGVVLGTNYRF